LTALLFSTDTEIIRGHEGTGTVTITAWDHHHVQGTFEFQASERLSEAERRVTVAGAFDFTCTASVSCE